MTDSLYTIGIDYGTLSMRAVLVRVSDGQEMGSVVFEYPHSVIDEYLDAPGGKIKLGADWALQDPQDYLDALPLIRDLLGKCGVCGRDVIGVGVDFTACTLLPVYSDGTPLCFDEKFADNPHAYVKLWKNTSAQKYATQMTDLAVERGEKWLDYCGGKISSEHLFPKLMQTLNEAPEVYAAADYFIDAGDWLVWQLTGVQSRSSCMAGYKALWLDGKYPSKDYFKELDPRLENVVEDKLNCPISTVGSRVGCISRKAAEITGLSEGTPVAAAVIDAHAAAPAVKVKPGKMFVIMGTSGCYLIPSEKNNPVPGIMMLVRDGILPGYQGYEAGQSCLGDHFAWFAENLIPSEYAEEARERGISPITLISEKANALKPGESGLIALDWWNGNRSILSDSEVSGLFVGMTLSTKAEEMYRALIEATAYGARVIIENYREHGIEVDSMVASGGITKKNTGMMQIYADILGIEIRIAGSNQGSALGSAIFAACAAGSENGGYDSLDEASEKMGSLSDAVYIPNPENAAVYDKLYAEYKFLHDFFGRGGNDVMKRLRSIRKEASK